MAPPPPLACGKLQRRLLQAAADGNLGAFKRIASALDGGKGRIREAVEAVREDEFGSGALHAAALHGRTRAGADVTKGIGKFTPLILAVHDGLTDFYECLLEAGADPNAPDEYGHLPIEIAAYENRWKDVEILLRLTARIPSVHDWTVDGVLAYVKSIPTDQDDPVYKMKLADLKLEANKAYKRKDYYTAAKLYTAALNADSGGEATLYSNRSLWYIKLGEGEKALIDAEFCWIMEPHWPKACYRKGAAYMLLKDYEKARDAFLDGLKLDPTNAEMENALKVFERLEDVSYNNNGLGIVPCLEEFIIM